MSADITLLIPGLGQQLKACKNAGLSLAECPTLTYIMRHPQAYTAFGLDPTLSQLFSLPITQDFPHAALQSFAQTKKKEGHWKALLSPVALIADKDGLLLDANHTYRLQPSIFEEIKTIASDYGFQLKIETNGTWMLSSVTTLQVTTTALFQAQYQRIDTLLPKGKDALKLRQFMNDCQMTLAYIQQKSQFEQSPEEIIRLPNAFWVHGTGNLPDRVSHPWTNLYCSTTIFDSIAQLSGCPQWVKPNSFHEIKTNSKGLVLFDSFSHMMQEFDMNELLEKLVNLEVNWLQPIAIAKKRKRLDSAILNPCDGQRYNISEENLAEKFKRFCGFKR